MDLNLIIPDYVIEAITILFLIAAFFFFLLDEINYFILNENFIISDFFLIIGLNQLLLHLLFIQLFLKLGSLKKT